jgi:transcriptional regulator with XRE-family HTH domain
MMFAQGELSRKANVRCSRPDMLSAAKHYWCMTGTLHIHLRAHRKRRRLTLEKVAAEMGIAKNTLSEKENGIKRITLDELEKLAEIYGCSPLALLMAPDDGPRAEAMREAADIARTRDPQALQDWLSMGKHLPTSET